jgi:hypothetical protein
LIFEDLARNFQGIQEFSTKKFASENGGYKNKLE